MEVLFLVFWEPPHCFWVAVADYHPDSSDRGFPASTTLSSVLLAGRRTTIYFLCLNYDIPCAPGFYGYWWVWHNSERSAFAFPSNFWHLDWVLLWPYLGLSTHYASHIWVSISSSQFVKPFNFIDLDYLPILVCFLRFSFLHAFQRFWKFVLLFLVFWVYHCLEPFVHSHVLPGYANTCFLFSFFFFSFLIGFHLQHFCFFVSVLLTEFFLYF